MSRRLRTRCEGRGRNYSAGRGLIESALRVGYAGDWPGRLWGLVPGASRVHTVHHRLNILPPGTPDLRIGFLSDLHVGPTTPPGVLETAADRLSLLQPDVLLLGGDYVFLDATESRCQHLEALISRIPARLKAGVLGNHDLWTRHDRIEAALVAAGVRVLVNEALRLPPPWEEIALVGLDEPWTGEPDAEAALEGAGDAAMVLGLGHSPDALPFLQDRVALLLCGHTHGGQVALPGGRPIVVPGPVGNEYPHGLHEVGETLLMVSRGLGGVEIPVRMFAPPDVVLLELVGR